MPRGIRVHIPRGAALGDERGLQYGRGHQLRQQRLEAAHPHCVTVHLQTQKGPQQNQEKLQLPVEVPGLQPVHLLLPPTPPRQRLAASYLPFFFKFPLLTEQH